MKIKLKQMDLYIRIIEKALYFSVLLFGFATHYRSILNKENYYYLFFVY